MEFPITVCRYRGLVLCLHLFAPVMDELTNTIQDEITWCMLFAGDIVLNNKISKGINQKLKPWGAKLS